MSESGSNFANVRLFACSNSNIVSKCNFLAF